MSKLKGSCLCGAVSYEVINEFDRLFLCSCDQCRQITGSAFASNLFIMADGFDWLSGDGKEAVWYRRLAGTCPREHEAAGEGRLRLLAGLPPGGDGREAARRAQVAAPPTA